MRPNFGTQPIRDLMRWIAIEGAHGQRVTDALLFLLSSSSLLRRVDLKSLAHWLAWLSERAMRPGLGHRLSGLALWVACRMRPGQQSEAQLRELRRRYAQSYRKLSHAVPEAAGALYRLQISWPKLLSGMILDLGFLPAETTAANALAELERVPAWLTEEPLLPKVLASFPEFRKAYQAKLAETKR